jgi:hypothetical protein
MPAYFEETRAIHKDGIIYIFGGLRKNDPNGPGIMGYNHMKYTISTNTFEFLTPPVDAKSFYYTSGAVLIDDKVYIMVDNIFDNGSAVAINTRPYVYNITSNT